MFLSPGRVSPAPFHYWKSKSKPTHPCHYSGGGQHLVGWSQIGALSSAGKALQALHRLENRGYPGPDRESLDEGNLSGSRVVELSCFSELIPLGLARLSSLPDKACHGQTQVQGQGRDAQHRKQWGNCFLLFRGGKDGHSSAGIPQRSG